jgi:hypothetical protein
MILSLSGYTTAPVRAELLTRPDQVLRGAELVAAELRADPVIGRLEAVGIGLVVGEFGL